MLKLKIVIEANSPAFHPNPAPEVAWILRTVAKAVTRDGFYQTVSEGRTLYDTNGNSVGIAVWVYE